MRDTKGSKAFREKYGHITSSTPWQEECCGEKTSIPHNAECFIALRVDDDGNLYYLDYEWWNDKEPKKVIIESLGELPNVEIRSFCYHDNGGDSPISGYPFVMRINQGQIDGYRYDVLLYAHILKGTRLILDWTGHNYGMAETLIVENVLCYSRVKNIKPLIEKYNLSICFDEARFLKKDLLNEIRRANETIEELNNYSKIIKDLV